MLALVHGISKLPLSDNCFPLHAKFDLTIHDTLMPQLGLWSEHRVPAEADRDTPLSDTLHSFKGTECNCDKHNASTLRAFLASGQPFITTGYNLFHQWIQKAWLPSSKSVKSVSP